MPKQVDCFIAVALVVASEIAPTTAANAEWDRTILPRPPQPFQGITKMKKCLGQMGKNTPTPSAEM